MLELLERRSTNRACMIWSSGWVGGGWNRWMSQQEGMLHEERADDVSLSKSVFIGFVFCFKQF